MPLFFFRFFLSLILVLALGGASQACSVCGCGDPLASAGTARPLAESFRLDLSNVYLTANAQSDDDPTQTESVRQVNLNGTLTYSATNDLSFTLVLPLVEKYWSLSAGDAPAVPGGTLADAGTPFGIGDVMVGARWFFLSELDLKQRAYNGLALSGGLYLPTGGTDFKSGVTGDNLDTHAQLGTGAFGFYGGLLYSYGADDFNLSANANVITRTQALTDDANSPVYRYTFGTALTGGVTGQLKADEALAFSLGLEGRWAASDRKLNDAGDAIIDAPNTGGTVLDVTPGFAWNLSGDSTLYAKVQIPFFTSLNGTQEVDPTYTVGTQFLIH